MLTSCLKGLQLRPIQTVRILGQIRNYAQKRKENAVIKPLGKFVNRNPRNLERLAYSVKDFGWGIEGEGYGKTRASNLPKRNYYHRLTLTKAKYNTYAEVEHVSGEVVLSASTLEWPVKRHLYSHSDATACINLGKIIAGRCLRAGISCVSCHVPHTLETDSESFSLFCKAAEDEGLVLEEPSNIRLEYTPPHYQPTGPAPPEPD